ncbi:MAG: ABC transporter permease [Oscillospiraceae bacterium]|nr:ABC transporter permease [Oscillospiraceae bacterium]
MKNLLKADSFYLRKSRLTLIALILAVAFPILTALLYWGLSVLTERENILFSANNMISSVFSLTSDLGLVLPVFAGVFVCQDFSNGTLRNKVIAGNRRSAIYLSHLLVSMAFLLAVIAIYAVVTTALALLFFPFKWDSSRDLGLEITYFVSYGLTSFVFIATVSTMFAMILRRSAPTIILTIVFSIVLAMVNSILMAVDYESFQHVVYFIPTFGGNFFSLNSLNSLSILRFLNGSADASRSLIFAEGMLSYLFFGALHTLIGLFVFKKRDIK